MKKSLVLFCLLASACNQAPESMAAKIGQSEAASSTPAASVGSGNSTASPSPAVASPPTSAGSNSPGAVQTPSPTAGATSDKAPVVASPGCNKEPTQALAQYKRKTVTGSSRVYDMYLPEKYDKQKPYRLLVLAHSCGGEFVPFKMEGVSKGEAIIVSLRAVASQTSGDKYQAGCFVYTMAAEGSYFDQVLKDVEAETCVDTNRIFMGGFSSGSWLTDMFGCTRGNILRAQGTAAGGLASLPACTGPIAAMLIHDKDDKENTFAGGEKVRDRILKVNECSTETEPYSYDNDPKTASVCVKYKGCKAGYPVIWCPTSGKGHSSNEPYSTVGLWNFWSQF